MKELTENFLLSENNLKLKNIEILDGNILKITYYCILNSQNNLESHENSIFIMPFENLQIQRKIKNNEQHTFSLCTYICINDINIELSENDILNYNNVLTKWFKAKELNEKISDKYLEKELKTILENKLENKLISISNKVLEEIENKVLNIHKQFLENLDKKNKEISLEMVDRIIKENKEIIKITKNELQNLIYLTNQSLDEIEKGKIKIVNLIEEISDKTLQINTILHRTQNFMNKIKSLEFDVNYFKSKLMETTNKINNVLKTVKDFNKEIQFIIEEIKMEE